MAIPERDAIWRFDSTLASATPIAREGEGPGEVRGVWAVQPAAGDVMVTEFSNGGISFYDEDGTFLRSRVLPTPPYGATRLSDGSIVVALEDSVHYAVLVEDTDVTPFARRPPGLLAMRTRDPERYMQSWPSVAATPDGWIHVLDNTVGALVRYDRSGAVDRIRLFPKELRKAALDERLGYAKACSGFLGGTLAKMTATGDGRLLIEIGSDRAEGTRALVVDPETYVATRLSLPTDPPVAVEPIWVASALSLDGDRLFASVDTAILEYRVRRVRAR